MSHAYRQAASLVVLKSRGDGLPVLLLRKPRKRDAWQLPQGGIEGAESIEEAALRELREETGITSATLFGRSRRVYQYDFSLSYRRFRPDNILGQRIEFVFALVPEDVHLELDRKEVVGFAWVRPSQLGNYIKRKEYLEIVRKLSEEGIRLAAENANVK